MKNKTTLLKKSTLFQLLQVATAAVFFGRAYQHLFWDAPFRTLLWDENLMSGIVTGVFGMDWESYINSMAVDDGVNWTIKAFGVLYLICGMVALSLTKIPRIFQKILLIGAVGLILLSLLLWKEKFYSVGQFFEYSLQFGAPLFLYTLMRRGEVAKRWWFWLRMAMAATFVCHGLYAIGYYPQPGHFMDMTVEILGVSNETASLLLKIMGVLDFLVAAMLFVPRLQQPALAYMVFWGFVTALARIWTNFDFGEVGTHLHQTVYEMVYRWPHFLVPLGAWYERGTSKAGRGANHNSANLL